MKFFAIDLYLWYEPASLWILIPTYSKSSSLRWSLKLTQSEILACDVGITFRVDDVLLLGNERDIFPLEVVIFDLEKTISDNIYNPQLLSNLRISEFLSIEIKQNRHQQILLSRLNTRQDKDYLDRVASFVGTYYKNFAVNKELWVAAVSDTLDGLATVFDTSESDINSKDEPLAKWLIDRYRILTI